MEGEYFPTAAPGIRSTRRGFLAGSTALVACTALPLPARAALSKQDCDNLMAVLQEATATVKGASEWVTKVGFKTARNLVNQIADLQRRLAKVQDRESELEIAMLADGLSTIIGGIMVIAGVAVASSGGTLVVGGMTLTAGSLLATSVVVTPLLYIGQLATNDSSFDWGGSDWADRYTMVTLDGNMAVMVDNLAQGFGDLTSVVSQNIGKVLSLGGQLMGSLAALLSAREWFLTNEKENEVEEKIEELQARLAKLKKDLAELEQETTFVRFRRASAQAIVDDLTPRVKAECSDTLPPGKTIDEVLDAVPPFGSIASGGGSSEDETPKRSKRIRLIQQ